MIIVNQIEIALSAFHDCMHVSLLAVLHAIAVQLSKILFTYIEEALEMFAVGTYGIVFPWFGLKKVQIFIFDCLNLKFLTKF